MRKFALQITAIVAIALVAVLLIPRITLGEVGPKPSEGNSTNAIAASISDATTGSPLLQEGTDFTVSNERYFDNKQWLIVTVSPVDVNAGEPAVIALKLTDGRYKAVIGPGTSFTLEDLAELPQEAIEYMRELGRVAE